MVPSDRAAGLIAFAVVMMFISIIAVGLRFWSRALGSSDRGTRYWWDDWTALASLIVLIISHSLLDRMVALGYGRQESSIPIGYELEQLRVLFGLYFFYNFCITLPKVSVLLFYARVLGTRVKLFKYALWLTHCLVIGCFIAMGFFTIFLCDPVEKQWHPSIPGRCHSITDLWLASTISSVVIDLVLLLLPLPMLWRLQMKRAKKILIMAVFAFGYCVIIVSIGCVITIFNTANAINEDPFYASVPSMYWLSSQAPISVVSICLPNMSVLFRRLINDGPKSIFSLNRSSSKFKLLRNHTKELSKSSSSDDTSRRLDQLTADVELGNQPLAAERTTTVSTTNPPILEVISPLTILHDGIRSNGPLRIPETAIHVRSDFKVETAS